MGRRPILLTFDVISSQRPPPYVKLYETSEIRMVYGRKPLYSRNKFRLPLMKAKYIVCFFLLLLTLVACEKEEIINEGPAQRTVLIYFAGDNNLGSFIDQNLKMIKEGIKNDGLNNGNLLIYSDKSGDTPKLFQLKMEADTVRQIDIRTYEADQNSASTETLTEVIDQVKADFPADSYGLVLWSHGSAWLPGNISSYLRSFGVDGNATIDINDLASALSQYHFDFLLFDACYMSSTEVAYALRGCTDYVIGSPTEVLADGFPYKDIIGPMFKKEADVNAIAERFYEHYSQSLYPYATVSVIKSSEMAPLAAVCREIFHGKTEQDLFDVPAGSLQQMEYLTPTYHALYDFDDYVSRLATKEQYAAFRGALDKAVVYKATTPKSYFAYGGGIRLAMDKFSGLSIYVPQEALSKLNEWYKDLEWYKDVY